MKSLVKYLEEKLIITNKPKLTFGIEFDEQFDKYFRDYKCIKWNRVRDLIYVGGLAVWEDKYNSILRQFFEHENLHYAWVGMDSNPNIVRPQNDLYIEIRDFISKYKDIDFICKDKTILPDGAPYYIYAFESYKYRVCIFGGEKIDIRHSGKIIFQAKA